MAVRTAPTAAAGPRWRVMHAERPQRGNRGREPDDLKGRRIASARIAASDPDHTLGERIADYDTEAFARTAADDTTEKLRRQ